MIVLHPTYVLVRDDLDILNVTSSFEDLTQNILSDARVQTTNIQGSLVGLRGGAANEGTGTAGGCHIIAGHGRGDSGRNWIGVGRDVQRRRRHVALVGGAVLTIFVSGSTSIGLRGRRQLGARSNVIGHL